MGRQLWVGVWQLTKIARNGCSTKSPFLKPNSNSHSHLWRICSPPNPNGTIRNGTSNVLFHSPPKFPVTLLYRRSVRSFNSLDRRRRSIFRRFTSNGVVLGLIVTNVAVFVLWRVADTRFMVKNFMISVEHVVRGQLQTVITSAFSHLDMFHLITNVFGLYFFGTSIGRTFGQEYLLKLYLGGAVAGSIFYVVYQAFLAPPTQGKLQGVSNLQIPSQGASGAVNAIMLLDVFLFPTKTILLLGCLVVGSDIFRLSRGDPLVSASTHLGGATAAAFAWLRHRKRRFRRF